MSKNLQDLREDYRLASLEMSDTDADAIRQFTSWFAEAEEAEVPEPNAMTLATATPDGVPSARIVLLKGMEAGAFTFYTNYASHKGQELAQNPQAALLFLWHALQRQVRISGRVERISQEASTVYFQSRPKGSQIGAWASPQSEVIPNREILEQRVAQLEQRFKDVDQLPLPDHWGGYRLIPHTIEFWQGRTSRLHDRIRYTRQDDGSWLRERLAP